MGWVGGWSGFLGFRFSGLGLCWVCLIAPVYCWFELGFAYLWEFGLPEALCFVWVWCKLVFEVGWVVRVVFGGCCVASWLGWFSGNFVAVYDLSGFPGVVLCGDIGGRFLGFA